MSGRTNFAYGTSLHEIRLPISRREYVDRFPLLSKASAALRKSDSVLYVLVLVVGVLKSQGLLVENNSELSLKTL